MTISRRRRSNRLRSISLRLIGRRGRALVPGESHCRIEGHQIIALHEAEEEERTIVEFDELWE